MRVVDPVEVSGFGLGWVAGVASALTVEFLKRRVFDRPQLTVAADFGSFDVSWSPLVVMVSAVNSSSVPVILKRVSYDIWYRNRSIGIPGPLGEADREFPFKLDRHEGYDDGGDVRDWLRHFLLVREVETGDSSPIDCQELEFQVRFFDTTGRSWATKRLRLSEREASLVEADLLELSVEGGARLEQSMDE